VNIPKKAKLTNKLCRSLPFAETGQRIIRDSEISGFMVVIGRKKRTYTLQIDVMVLGQRRTVKRKIGDVLEIDANAARTEAQRLAVEIRSETTKHLNRRKSLSFGQAWQDYARRFKVRIASGERSMRTFESYHDCVERLLSDWLTVPLREIGEQPELVAEKHRQITQANGSYQANRAMSTLRIIYNHALKKRLDPNMPPHNPVASVDFNIEERRSSGMGPDQLQDWAKQLHALPNPVRREFHLFSLLSAMRPDALIKARWEHLKVKERTLFVPEPKGGKRRAFYLPLSRPMLRCFWRARKAGRLLYGQEARVWIFPAATPTGHIAEYKEKRQNLSHWGNDLRQTWRTCAQIVGLSELDARILMNHSLGSVNADYITTQALRDHLITQQERVSSHIMGLLSG
jgi:integrase